MEKKTKGRILIVDAEENIRETYKEIFELEGYEVRTAKHAILGAMMIGNFDGPDVIILDWKLSQVPLGKDGPDILRHFWEDKKYNVPIILHSVNSKERDFDIEVEKIEKEYNRRIYKNIPKPYLQELIDTVNDLFDSEDFRY